MIRSIEFECLDGPKYYIRDREAEDLNYRSVVGPLSRGDFSDYLTEIVLKHEGFILNYISDLNKQQAVDSSPAEAGSPPV